MLSFKLLSSVGDSELQMLKTGLSLTEQEELMYALPQLEAEDDTEYAVAVMYGCLLVRIFDMGRYLFLFPYPLSDDANVKLALEAMGEYARREEIPFCVTEVPYDMLYCFCGFRHMDLDALDETGTIYRVKVKTECQILDKIPPCDGGRVVLSAITAEDSEEYAAVCRNDEINKFWGYDFREDAPDADDGYFAECAMRDFECGRSITYAVRYDGVLVGEAVIYAFDGKGNAEIAIRILPSYQKQGIGTKTLELLKQVCCKIGLCKLYAKVMEKNSASVKFFSSVAKRQGTDESGVVDFLIELT